METSPFTAATHARDGCSLTPSPCTVDIVTFCPGLWLLALARPPPQARKGGVIKWDEEMRAIRGSPACLSTVLCYGSEDMDHR
jgi:hypothetical protein